DRPDDDARPRAPAAAGRRHRGVPRLRSRRRHHRHDRQRHLRAGGRVMAGAEMVAAARAGDESAFSALVEPHRRELHVHCYRMLGSFDEAEDLVQETLLRAWRARSTFDRGLQLRAWLYRIATHVCLDHLKSRSRRVPSMRAFAEIPWLQPYPDTLLDEIAPPDAEPAAIVAARQPLGRP